MRVLAVSSYGGLGGAELALATFLEHRPPEVEAEAVLVSDGPLGALLERQGVPSVAGHGFEARPTLRALVRFTRALAPHLRRIRPDVVWATGQKAALLSLPACRAAGVPLVWHKVDFSWDRLLAKPLAAGAQGVVCVSRAACAALGPLRARRLLGVVGPPVRLPADLVARPDPERPVIGTLARLVPYKGHHHILRAAALLGEEFPALRVVLAGSGAPQYPDYPRSLEVLAEELGLSDRVELPGHIEAVEPVLERLTVFVNATYRDAQGFGFEGLSGAMLEASWAGIPVVAVRGGGTAEGLRDGATGTLVEAAEPRLLARAIAPYLRHPDLRERTGAAARAHARANYAPGVAARRLFSLLAAAAR